MASPQRDRWLQRPTSLSRPGSKRSLAALREVPVMTTCRSAYSAETHELAGECGSSGTLPEARRREVEARLDKDAALRAAVLAWRTACCPGQPWPSRSPLPRLWPRIGRSLQVHHPPPPQHRCGGAAGTILALMAQSGRRWFCGSRDPGGGAHRPPHRLPHRQRVMVVLVPGGRPRAGISCRPVRPQRVRLSSAGHSQKFHRQDPAVLDQDR